MTIKHDKGKRRFSLLPPGWISIIDVLEFGASKYAVDNWKTVPNPRTRYFDAAQRHLWAFWDGERADPETGISHLAHAGTCILFLLWFEREAQADQDEHERIRKAITEFYRDRRPGNSPDVPRPNLPPEKRSPKK